MKIIIVTGYFEPRLGYQEPNLARELGKLGHDVYVVTSDKRYQPNLIKSLSISFGERNAKVGFAVEDGINVVRLKSRFEISTRTWLKDFEKTIVDLKPDVVVCNGLARISAFRFAFLKWRKKLTCGLLLEEHMVYSVVRRGFLGNFFYLLFRCLVRPLFLSQCESFVAVTEETKVYMGKELGLPLSKIKIVPLGVNNGLFQRDESARKELRNQYNILEEDVVFMYAGKVIPNKGPHLLIDAGLKLLGRYKNIKLFIVGNGEGNYLKQMKDKVEEHGFSEQVLWCDAVDNKELHKYYSAADVGVWPLEESMTMLEAASCRLPIIVRDSLSLRDRISNGNGFGYKEYDIEDLSKHMETCLTDTALRKQMGENGRELIEKRMNWEVIAKQYVELYTDIAAKP